MKFTRFRYIPFYPIAGWLHAAENGGPVLIEESSWRTVNGAFVNHPRIGWVGFEFRRT